MIMFIIIIFHLIDFLIKYEKIYHKKNGGRHKIMLFAKYSNSNDYNIVDNYFY